MHDRSDARTRSVPRHRLVGAVSTLLCVVALAACDTSKPAAATDAVAATGAAGASTAAVACPSKTLAGFVAAFAEDPALQKAFTADTVDTAFVDWNAQPEPAESVEALPRARLNFPVMPNRARQRDEGLRYREVSVEGDRAVVALEVPDTDAQLLYTFRRDACWTLVKLVDPAFGKAFAGEAPPAAAPAGADANAAIVREVMRAQYGTGHDSARDCWPTAFEDAGERRDYCMRAGPSTVVQTPGGRTLLFLANNIQDVDATPRRYSYSAPDPGLVGLFAVTLGQAGGWTAHAVAKAEPLGTGGDCGCADARPTRLGRDLYGWILSSGGVWQGTEVSNFSVYAPVGGRYASIGTIADVEEDRQDVRHRIAVDDANPDAAHYPLTVATLRDGRETDRRTIAYDPKRGRYRAPNDR